MFGPYQLRELRRQLTSLALLLGFLWLTMYLAQDFDLLRTYRRITNQSWSKLPPSEKPATVVPTPADSGTQAETEVAPTPVAPAAPSFDITSLQVSEADSAALIKRGESAIRARIDTYGLQGAIESVNACYAQAEKLRQGTAFQYCFFLDLTAQIDLRAQAPFFSYGLPFRRVVSALINVGIERDAGFTLMNQWDAVYKQFASAWHQ